MEIILVVIELFNGQADRQTDTQKLTDAVLLLLAAITPKTKTDAKMQTRLTVIFIIKLNLFTKKK
jgi:hypothetical protein